MNIIDTIFGTTFGYIMHLCYTATGNFGWAIIVFTVLTRLILFPISLISQKNSIIMVKIKPALDDLQARFGGEPSLLLQEQKALFKKEKYSAIKSILPLLVQIPLIIGVISVVNNPTRHLGEDVYSYFFGMDMLSLPDGFLVPALAILSTIFLCVMQNFYNVISREQGFLGKWGVMIFLTVFTGWFVFIVPAGVGLFWTCANIFGVVSLAICNIIYNPKKFIDYENRSVKMKPTKEEKAILRERKKLEKVREKEDMQRFTSVKKELVFFSEKSGFYKYFEHFIEYIIAHSDITIHYLTADINDQVFKLTKPQFQTYFCSDHKLIFTFMEMDCDILVMTLADFNVYHYKRSIVNKNIEYIHIEHGSGSSYALTLRENAITHYDTIFCNGKDSTEEIREIERIYGLKEKNLVSVGYGLLDMLIESYSKADYSEKKRAQILVAPSWQRDNILEICLDPLLEGLFKLDADIIVRPHPEFIKRFPAKMKAIFEKYDCKINSGQLEIQTDFSSNSTVYSSDLLITDWSTIGAEFSFTTKKPTLYINTPMKVMNLNWRKIGIEPIEFRLRNRIGYALDTDKLVEVDVVARHLLESGDGFKAAIEKVMEEHFYNIGNTAEVGGKYIIDKITERRQER